MLLCCLLENLGSNFFSPNLQRSKRLRGVHDQEQRIIARNDSRPIFCAGTTPKIPFLGLSLLPNHTETLATRDIVTLFPAYTATKREMLLKK